MTNLMLRCESPKRLAGEYDSNSFEELYLWVSRNFKRPKGLVNSHILVVAEGGEYKSLVRGSCIEVVSDVRLGYGAKELARKIGLLRTVTGGD